MYRFCCAQWGYGLPAILARSWRRWENLHAQGWIFLVYGEYLPGTTRGKAAQNSAARLIGGATFHSMDGFSPGDALQNRQDGKKLLRCSRSGDARLFYWWDLSDSAKPLGRFAGSMWMITQLNEKWSAKRVSEDITGVRVYPLTELKYQVLYNVENS